MRGTPEALHPLAFSSDTADIFTVLQDSPFLDDINDSPHHLSLPSFCSTRLGSTLRQKIIEMLPRQGSVFFVQAGTFRRYIVRQVEYVEDLEEDESDIEDAADWGGTYWGAPGSKAAAGGDGEDSDSERDEDDGDHEDDDGEFLNLKVLLFLNFKVLLLCLRQTWVWRN